MKVAFSATGVGKRQPFPIQNTYFNFMNVIIEIATIYYLFGEIGKRFDQICTHFII